MPPLGAPPVVRGSANRARGAGKAHPLLSAPADPGHLERSHLARPRRGAGAYALAITTSHGGKRGVSYSVPLCCGATAPRTCSALLRVGGWLGTLRGSGRPFWRRPSKPRMSWTKASAKCTGTHVPRPPCQFSLALTWEKTSFPRNKGALRAGLTHANFCNPNTEN